MPQRDAALMFDISLSAISLRSPKWKDDGCESDLPRIAEVVRRAIVLRRELTGDRTADAENDKGWCTLPVAKPALSAGDMLFGVAQRRGKKRATAEAEACFRDDWQRSEAKRIGHEAAGAGVGEARVAWPEGAHEAQLPPGGAWRVWMMMGGRGAGKTRAGAEWVRDLVERGLAKRIALVGPTLHDVREVMIGGPSGLCAVASTGMRPVYSVTRRRLEWPEHGPCAGAVAFAFSAEDPDSLRGPQFDARVVR